MLPKREGEGAGHSEIVTMLPPRSAPAAQQKVMLSIGDYNAPHARLASFRKNPHPWPHARPAPEDLAAAGFFYDPYGIVTGLPPGMGHLSPPMSPPTGEEEEGGDTVGGEDHPPHPMDGTTCPSCELSVDGWEPDDDPFEEHTARSPRCRMAVALKRRRSEARAAPAADAVPIENHKKRRALAAVSGKAGRPSPETPAAVDGDFPRRQTGIAQMDKAGDGTPISRTISVHLT
ncbi:hypothetical protein GGTG_02258 [Gaeumannomyces tritici R3-111a-1]|uniref:Uncharacterized protein n=1 Tax=Gaeumannomyces tritici (strain R3-111a-1) TaxID=644352 RepID=J3NLV8_GAET3|nr:hypothetical protein GGTG_02258 [Gaeumannomyces tritici R3-111a-1]EJT82284.1 hypothetical protein GGTG_02258 [Gaeumannomyces tritici R3-111a-1]